MVGEDAVWRYYNCPNPIWSARCKLCREGISAKGVPVRECVDCWKLEVWEYGKAFAQVGPVDFDNLMDQVEIQELSFGAVHDDRTVVAKASRAAIQIVRTGLPVEGYPDGEIDSLLVVYALSIAERERARFLVARALGLTTKEAALIPIRRGCWRFDDVLGPWQTWHQVDRDWE